MWKIKSATSPGCTHAAQKGLKDGNKPAAVQIGNAATGLRYIQEIRCSSVRCALVYSKLSSLVMPSERLSQKEGRALLKTGGGHGR